MINWEPEDPYITWQIGEWRDATPRPYPRWLRAGMWLVGALCAVAFARAAWERWGTREGNLAFTVLVIAASIWAVETWRSWAGWVQRAIWWLVDALLEAESWGPTARKSWAAFTGTWSACHDDYREQARARAYNRGIPR